MAAARLEPKLANLINLESAVTDAFCVVGTAAIIDILVGGTTGAAGPAVTLLRSFGIGTIIGLVAGLIWRLFLKVMRDHEHAYPITLSVLLVLYVVIDKLGGSAALGILFVALILGNAPALSKKIGLAQEVSLDTSVRGFHRQMAFIIKSFFFVFIGAMLGPPWGQLLLGLLLGGVLIGARIPAVRLALLGSGLDPDQRRIVTVSLPRGMAAGVLATLPFTKGVPGTDSLPVVVFSAVFMSIIIFAVGFYFAKKRIEPSDASEGQVPIPAGGARPSGNYRPATPTHATPAPQAGPGATLPMVPTPHGSSGGEDPNG
jgi:cell volume regulation protein A